MTGLAAQIFALENRGTIAEGQHADLVLFDPQSIIDRATYDDPTQAAEGVKMVLVNGRTVLRDGVPTAARPGRILRRGVTRP